MTRKTALLISFFPQFLKNEASGGIVLIIAVGLALVVANSPLSSAYFDILRWHVVGLSILHWINDALMVMFFFW